MFKKYYYKKVWGSIGFIVNLSQMIEYNLANILGLNEILSAFDEIDSINFIDYNDLVKKTNKWYEKLTKKELGKLQGFIEEKNIFTKDFINEIDHIREERNYFIHHIFKDDLFSKEFQNNPKQYILRLQNLVDRMNEINLEICSIFENMKKEVKSIY